MLQCSIQCNQWDLWKPLQRQNQAQLILARSSWCHICRSRVHCTCRQRNFWPLMLIINHTSAEHPHEKCSGFLCGNYNPWRKHRLMSSRLNCLPSFTFCFSFHVRHLLHCIFCCTSLALLQFCSQQTIFFLGTHPFGIRCGINKL